MKYETSIDLENPATSNAKLIGWIPPGSEVLEIGSASGSLTRVLSEVKNCRVSVIEVDPESFRAAHQAAADGFCGDAEAEDWEAYYRGRTFDVILLSNVLEHLCNPLSLLRRTKKYLKKGGHILISIPNAAHNDILLNLMKDDFHYTETGLLDESHLHLFGEKNYYRLIRDAGLHIRREDRVYLDTGETEQNPSVDGIPEDVRQFLSRRRNGEVYQFTADLTEEGEDGSLFDEENRKNAPRLLSERQQIIKLEQEIRAVQDYAHQLERDRDALEANAEKREREIREIQEWARHLERDNRELTAGSKKREEEVLGLREEMERREERHRRKLRELKNAQQDERILYEAEIAQYRREQKRRDPAED